VGRVSPSSKLKLHFSHQENYFSYDSLNQI
jgi:hypothetical protein